LIFYFNVHFNINFNVKQSVQACSVGCVSISTRPETKTMTNTPVSFVGVAYMLMWTSHHSVGVVTWLLSTNQDHMS